MLDPAVVAGVLGEELQTLLVPEVAAAVLHAQAAVPVGRRELGSRDVHHRHLPRGHQEAVGFQDHQNKVIICEVASASLASYVVQR